MADKPISKLVLTSLLSNTDNFVLERAGQNLRIQGASLTSLLRPQIQNTGVDVGDPATTINFSGAGISSITETSPGVIEVAISGGGASTFTALTDVPASYATFAGQGTRVNGTETGLEFYDIDSTVRGLISVAAGSSTYLGYDSGTGEISIKALAVTSVTVNGTSTSLADFVSTFYTAGTEFQEGDTIILNGVPSGQEIYMQNGGSAGTTADFTLIEQPQVTTLDGLTDTNLTGVAQGDVLYYNGTAWVNLGPGTAGQVLTTQGAGANPNWTTVAGGSSIVTGNNTSAGDTTQTMTVGDQITFVQSGDFGNNAMLILEANATGVNTVAKTRYKSTTADRYLDIGINGAGNTVADQPFIIGRVASGDEMLISQTASGGILRLQSSDSYMSIWTDGTAGDSYVNMGGDFDAPRTNAVYGGLRLPYGTTANRPVHGGATDLEGYIRYNSTTNKIEGYELSGGWQDLISAGADTGNILDTNGLTMAASRTHTLTNGTTMTWRNSDGSPIDNFVFTSTASQGGTLAINKVGGSSHLNLVKTGGVGWSEMLKLTSDAFPIMEFTASTQAKTGAIRFHGTSGSGTMYMETNNSAILINNSGHAGSTAGLAQPSARWHVISSSGQTPFRVDTNSINNVLSVGTNGKVSVSASVAGNATFNIPHGATPTSPVNGDIWTTTTSAYARINGVTVDLGGGGGSDGNGIYDGSGTVAAGTVATLTDTINFTGGLFGVGITPVTKVHILGDASGSGQTPLRVDTSTVTQALNVDNAGNVTMGGGSKHQFYANGRSYIGNTLTVGSNLTTSATGFRIIQDGVFSTMMSIQSTAKGTIFEQNSSGNTTIGSSVSLTAESSTHVLSVDNAVNEPHIFQCRTFSDVKVFEVSDDGTARFNVGTADTTSQVHIEGASGKKPLRVDTNAINESLLVDSNGRIGMNLAGSTISTSTRVHIHKQDTTHHLITTDTTTTGRTSIWMQGSGGSDLFMGIWGSAFAGINASYQGTSFFDTDVLHRFISRNAIGWEFVTDNPSLSAPVVEVSIGSTGIDVKSGNTYQHAGVAGFTGTGAYTNFTISGGIITSAS